MGRWYGLSCDRIGTDKVTLYDIAISIKYFYHYQSFTEYYRYLIISIYGVIERNRTAISWMATRYNNRYTTTTYNILYNKMVGVVGVEPTMFQM